MPECYLTRVTSMLAMAEAECAESAVSKLFGPMSPQQFVESYFEKRVLHVTNRPAAWFSDLFSQRAAEALLWERGSRIREFVDVVKDGSFHTPSGQTKAKDLFRWVYEKHRQGSTIVLRSLSEISLPIAQFARELERFFGGRVTANAYWSPSASKGFSAHFDTHDVFVVQIHGQKTWRLHGTQVELPGVRQAADVAGHISQSPGRELQLEEGHVLYLPRGVIHAAETSAHASLHLTFGLQTCRWVDLLTTAVQLAADADVSLRRTSQFAPMSEALTKEIEALLRRHGAGHLTVGDVRWQYEKTRVAEARPLPSSYFAGEDPVDDLTAPDFVVKRAGAICSVHSTGQQAAILFPCLSQGGALYGPPVIKPALQFIAEAAGPFSIQELPGDITEDGKVVLVARLIRDGLLLRAPRR